MSFQEYPNILRDEFFSKIYAHTKVETYKDGGLLELSGNIELLSCHAELTLKYANALICSHNLDNLLRLIISKLSTMKIFPNKMNILHVIIKYMVYHHDFGKITPSFQKKIMNEDLQIKALYEESKKKLKPTHSLYGKLLFDCVAERYVRDRVSDDEEVNALLRVIFNLSIVIDRHHSPLVNLEKRYNKIRDELNDVGEQLQEIVCKLTNISYTRESLVFSDKETYLDLHRNITDVFDYYEIKPELFFYLFKLLSSLLITSDYFATMDYMSNISNLDRIKDKETVISSQLLNCMEDSFFKKSYNQNLLNKAYVKKVRDRNLGEVKSLNELRERMLIEAGERLKEYFCSQKLNKSKIYYLHVPTGGGKTNISMYLALLILKHDSQINKIHYVFPYISIIEQNHQVIKETYGTKNIGLIYSTSSWDDKKNKHNSQNDEEAHIKYLLNNEFLSYPITVISSVNFFNTFVKDKKVNNYKFFSFANSVVIIDEIQTLRDSEWTLFQNILQYSSEFLNIHYIVMSATLPKLSILGDRESEAYQLLPNAEQYLHHRFFQNRVEIVYRPELKTQEKIYNELLLEINTYQHKKCLVVFNTVKDSHQFYTSLLASPLNATYNIELLNSSILPFRKKQLIKNIGNSKENIILVSTQSIEAGVDIDCDYGIRDFAIPESIIQTGGRINRHGCRERKKLVVSKIDGSADKIYRDNERWKFFKRYNEDEIRSLFKNMSLESYYSGLLKRIKKDNPSFFKETQIDGVRNLQKYEFSLLKEHNLIDDNTLRIMVAGNTPVCEFTGHELRFLGENDVLKNERDKTISHIDIYEGYQAFAPSPDAAFLEKKIHRTTWSSILAKCSISIYLTKKVEEIQRGKNSKILFCKNYCERTGLVSSELSEDDFL